MFELVSEKNTKILLRYSWSPSPSAINVLLFSMATWKFSFACPRNVTLRCQKNVPCPSQRDCAGKAERGSKGELREKTWLGWTLGPTLVRDIQSVVLGLPLGLHCFLGPDATCSIRKLSFRLLWDQTQLHWGPGFGRNFHGNDSCQIVSGPHLNLWPPIQGPGAGDVFTIGLQFLLSRGI